MAQVKGLTITFPPSDSPDVVGYKMYIIETPEAVDYDSPSVDLGNVTEIDMALVEGMSTKDGIYNLGIVAVDDAGNESSMSLANDVPLDFAPPNPPGAITFI